MSESTASISKQTKKPERKQALDRMADVWQKALEQFAQENNVSIEELTKAGDFGSASDGISKATTLFQNSRHPKDRTDKAIAAVGSCLDWIDDSVGFIKDHVSGTVGYNKRWWYAKIEAKIRVLVFSMQHLYRQSQAQYR